jgi:hypothetical protein
MKVIVKVTQSFKRLAKPLLKKYPSLNKELFQLENDLIKNPKSGKSLGNNTYKIRIAVQSKGTGKRGGLRAITYVETELIGLIEKNDEVITVKLIAIYDKSETDSISEKELTNLIRRILNE